MTFSNRISVKIIAAFLSLAMLALFLCSCTKEDKKFSSNENPNSITVTDLAGRTHIFSKPLNKVAVEWSCAGGPFMTMSAILGDDIADYLACRDDSPEKYRADVWKEYVNAVPKLKDVPVVGSADKELNLEGVLASGAQAFICPLELKKIMDGYISDILESADIPVIYVDFHKESIENHTKSTLLLGKLFSREERAQEIVSFYKEHRNNITQRVSNILKTQKRPNVYIEVGMKGPSDFGNSFDNNYSWGSIAYHSGGSSIGENAVFNLGPLNNEYILSRDPDIIVFTGACAGSFPDSIRMGYAVNESDTRKSMQAFFTRPGWKALCAYKNKKVYAINHGMAREMFDCACFEFFAKISFPEEFRDISPQKTLEDYYEKFMPYDLSGTWFVY